MRLKGLLALETWCKRITSGYPNVEITNMTSSWRNGLGFCAIIHHHCPDLIDFDNLRSEQVFENNSLAFQVAEDYLGIPSLLDPKDMVECEVVDKISIVTYLAQYYMALDNPAELQRRLRNTKLSQSFTASKIDDNNTGDTENIIDSIAPVPEEVILQGTGARKVFDTPSYILGERRAGTGCCLDTMVGQGEGGAFTTNDVSRQVRMETRIGINSDDTALKLDISKVTHEKKSDPKILGFGRSDYEYQAGIAPLSGDARVKNRQQSSYDLNALDKEIFDLDIEVCIMKIENLEKRRVELENKIRGFGLGQNQNPELKCGGKENDEELVVQLFDLVKEKNELFRKQSELIFTKKERMLMAEQALCEEQVRVILEKPLWLKTESDSLEEARLINKVVDIVRKRHEIVTHIDLDRMRENEDGDAIQDAEIKMSSCEEERKKILKTPRKNRLLSWVTRKNE